MIVIDLKPLSPEWFAYRERRITGSTVAAILGESKYSTPLNEWARIMGRIPRGASEENGYSAFGLETEALHRRWLAAESGWRVEDAPYVVQHPEIDWACCSPDGFAYDAEAAHPILVELKAPSPWTADEWDEKLPLAYQIQLQWNMLICDCPTAVLSVMLPPKKDTTGALMHLAARLIRGEGHHEALEACGWTRRQYDGPETEADPVFQGALIAKIRAWWDLHVVQSIAPEATGEACDKEALKALNADGAVELDFDDIAVSQVADLEALQAEIKERTAQAERIKNVLTQKAGAATWMDAKKAINAARRMVG